MIPADSAASAPASDAALALEDLVLLCQEVFFAWESAADPAARAGWGERYRLYTERLWHALASDLLVAARAWLRSGIASDIESMALHMFSCLLLELPKLKIDPSRNVRNFLLTVARRSQINEYRRSYAPRARQASAEPQASTPRLTRMWYALTGRNGASPAVGALEELADQRSHDAETLLIEQLDQREMLALVWGYWEQRLSADDLQIMQLRYHTEPPVQYDEIAQRLGDGWTSQAVRQRHHRAMQATRGYLQAMGWLGEEPKEDRHG